jgi:hypothetical protein
MHSVVRKIELVEEAERLADGDLDPDADARLIEIENSWSELPSAAKAQEALLLDRLRMAKARRVPSRVEAAPTDFATSAAKKHEVGVRLAILRKLWNPSAEADAFEDGDLGRRLRLALELKQAVSVPGDVEATRRRILRAVAEAVREWHAAGTVAMDQRAALLRQFQAVMRGFFA